MKKYSLFILSILVSFSAFNQNVDPEDYRNLDYRLIGPFRASRTVGGVGIPDQPNVFFVGVNNGGVWKTDDFGRTWNPIFDDAPTGSVGDLAVAPSNPNIIYVGSGEGLHRPDLSVGDGIFKSSDGGKTWDHIGLFDVQQVARIIVHPNNPQIVFVAGLGHPYGPNEERGVFRSTDGGGTWEKVLYVNSSTGSMQVEFDPNNPDILFADMWEHQEGPWENARFSGPNSGLYKSTDGGSTWRKITEGLPSGEEGLGRIGVAIAPSNSNRMYATVDAGSEGGVYRSDDAGESWEVVTKDYRIFGRGGDFAELKVHPNNQDIVYSGNIASYRSDDGGKSWTSIKGAPGGDDYHRIWINPIYPDIMLFVADQGATITVNGGKTWSSWYNQPTSQIYHVTTDNQFPYWVYGGQQESGAIAMASRGNGGQITFREFLGVSSDEYAYVAPDPKDPNIIYGGRVMKFDKRTGQSQNIAPEAVRSGKYRTLRTMPLMFHPKDDNMLLYASNVLWRTMDGGDSWAMISPDLTREKPEIPESVGKFRTEEMENMNRRAVIYAVGPSHIDVSTIWAGTDDGLVHVTVDGGKEWEDVTPPELKSWDKVSQIDAGHFDKNSALIAINAIRKDDMKPYIYRTQDLGKSWQLITNGLPVNGPVNVVREDPKQKGLLFAGTEREVYFSIDNGENWQSLRNNMPATSIRDLVIKDDDLVIGTHGRSIYIMDNINILREMAKESSLNPMFSGASSTPRVRWNMFLDTPLPPEEPTGENPPDGALFDYVLSKDADNVSLEIIDDKGIVIRAFSSQEVEPTYDTASFPHPTYWIRPFQKLGTSKGHHRFAWDLKHEDPRGARRSFSISAVYKKTPSGPTGPFVHPGSYIARLTADDTQVDIEVVVTLDPRVQASDEDIALQTELSMTCYNSYHKLQEMREEIDAMKKPKKKHLVLRGKGAPTDGDIQYGSIYTADPETETLVDLQHKYLFMLNVLQSADARPTTQAINGVQQLEAVKERLIERFGRK